MTCKKKSRLNTIDEVIRRLRFQHGVIGAPLDVEPDKKLGYKSRTTTRFCSDPIEEWTCPLCMKEFNGYGRSIVFPCWVCRDKRSIESFGSLWQVSLPEPKWSMSFDEAEAMNLRDNNDREQRRRLWLRRELRSHNKKLAALRDAGGAKRKEIESLFREKKRIEVRCDSIFGRRV